MKAKLIKGKSPEEIQIALEESSRDGFSPTLAICFISIKLDRVAITHALDDAGIAVFGTTTNAGPAGRLD